MNVRELGSLLPVALVWSGLALAPIGLLALILPRSRRRAAIAAGAGLLLLGVGVALPAPERRVAVPRTHLDALLPVFEFRERHATHVAAAPEPVFAAVHSVTADEIRLFRTLTFLRRFGRRGRESILNVPPAAPILDVATRTGFVILAEEPPVEVVLGTVVLAPRGARRPETADAAWFTGLTAPGYAKAAMSFRLEPDGHGGTDLVTETRVHATDATARRRFAIYWRTIYPGSALIRRSWLRAIRLRAER